VAGHRKIHNVIEQA